MPQIEQTEITSEESQQQLNNQESLHKDVLNKIKDGNVFKSLDLPNEEEPQQKQSKERVEEEQTQEESQQEETQETEESEEEVVPKSKIQPRIDQLTARLKAQQAEIDSLKNQTATSKDEIQSKLDVMSENELEDTLTQVRLAKEKSRDNDEKLLELVRLERKIEKTIVQAPQKFVQSQVQEFNSTVQRLATDGELSNDNYSKVLEIAKTIYQKYPKMQKAVDGQSMALELAVEHYKSLGKVTTGNETVQNLKAQNNNLKKKTLLDTKSLKSGGDKVNLDKLRSNAMTGSMKDKEKFAHNDPRFRIDAMIPDYLKG